MARLAIVSAADPQMTPLYVLSSDIALHGPRFGFGWPTRRVLGAR